MNIKTVTVIGANGTIVEKGWSKDTGGDVDTSNIGYLNNGVDIETVDIQKKVYFLADADLDTDKFKVVYLGSISEFNGLDILVETAKRLQDLKADNIEILVYGYGNRYDHLQKMIIDYGLKNIVLKGEIDKFYAMNLLSRGDLNIFTFVDTPLLKYGVSPNKLFMYFASGKPVLSLIRPKYDLVEGKNAGISINNDPDKAAETIIRFSRMEKEEYLEYSMNARKVAVEYDYKNLVNVLIEKIEG